ncbi:MAG: DUF1223 domain-containing protein [Rhodobacterales bacterium]|nr:MAG: DUF1223 domain-containing protein [Rhodobacterales bacterium]
MIDWFKSLTLAVVAIGAGPSLDARADGPVLVELFTSQGCSSCPPADALLEQLAMRNDVMPLSLHVDYWDYLGWRDAFATPQWTARQQAYAHEHGAKMVYTPQMIVAGAHAVIGSRAGEVAQALGDSLQAPEAVSIAIHDGRAVFDATSGMGALWVDYVRFSPNETTEITGGENAGERLSYVNVVTSWDRLATWDSSAQPQMEIDLPAAEGAGAVLIVQEPGPGAVLAVRPLD